MKSLVILFILSIFHVVAFGQEGIEPIAGNKELFRKGQLMMVKSQLDSTFIYTTDTITLPIFDDFSSDKFQKYAANFADAGVTSQWFYKLLDEFDVVIPASQSFTGQQTFHRTYDFNTNSTTDVILPTTTIKIGLLNTYPVQYVTTQVYPPYTIYDTIGAGVNEPDTVFFVNPDIQQDSIHLFFKHIQDPSKIWIDDNAYLNNRFAVNPWSVGVATFDGVDRLGYPYQMGTTVTNYGDYLTSKAINLTPHAIGDSLYLSFLYQKQGYGDAPESTDSLVLEFYDATAQQWRWAWSTNGGPLTEFKVAHVPIKQAMYFTDAFQFRFVNYGGLSGALDHFHIDYVHLRDFSGQQDTLIEDLAMVYPVYSLLKDYTAVPWDHYKNNPTGKTDDQFPVVIRNSYFNGNASISSASGGNVEVLYNTVSEGNIFLNGQVLANFNPPTQPNPDYAPRTTFLSYHDATSYQFDPMKTGDKQAWEIKTSVAVPVGSNFTGNDTVSHLQRFENYYAYDDGSAESAYGPTGTQAKLAIQYTPYEADSVIGVMMNFVPTVQDVTNQLFQITVWGDAGGQPGSVLYQDNAFFARTVDYGVGHNGFATYYFQDTLRVPVTGTFYIGWNQIDGERLGIGLDRNIDNHVHTFYQSGGNVWEQSQISGSVMIRPIFSTSMNNQLGISERPAKSYSVYPNPTDGWFTISDWTEGMSGKILDLSGKQLGILESASFDLSGYPAGVYIIHIQGEFPSIVKVMKR